MAQKQQWPLQVCASIVCDGFYISSPICVASTVQNTFFGICPEFSVHFCLGIVPKYHKTHSLITIHHCIHCPLGFHCQIFCFTQIWWQRHWQCISPLSYSNFWWDIFWGFYWVCSSCNNPDNIECGIWCVSLWFVWYVRFIP